MVLCASLKEFAKMENDRSMAAKKTHRGISKEKRSTMDLNSMIRSISSMINVGISFNCLTEKNNPTMAITALPSPAKVTTKNLPITICILLAGDVNNVSMVALSFSPAARSMAGYMAPKKQKITKK